MPKECSLSFPEQEQLFFVRVGREIPEELPPSHLEILQQKELEELEQSLDFPRTEYGDSDLDQIIKQTVSLTDIPIKMGRMYSLHLPIVDRE